jgi:hypothetical protein
MGRFPEFVAELVVGLLDWTHVIEKHNKQWAENARAYHRYVSSNDLCLTHALTDQYYDRTKRASEQEDPDLNSSHRRRNHGWAGGARLANSRHVSADFRRSIGISESAARTGGSRLCDRFFDSDEHAGIENRLPRPLTRSMPILNVIR